MNVLLGQLYLTFKATKSHLKQSYGKQNLTLVIISLINFTWNYHLCKILYILVGRVEPLVTWIHCLYWIFFFFFFFFSLMKKSRMKNSYGNMGNKFCSAIFKIKEYKTKEKFLILLFTSALGNSICILALKSCNLSYSLPRYISTLFWNRGVCRFEPCHEKIWLWGWQPGKTQTGLPSYRSQWE